ncbi:MAG: alpha/beta hydrolase [bacterium]|nr:alpha/beta hydrolase [bacterium]
MPKLLRSFLAGAVGFATIVIAMVWFEGSLIYYPTRHPDGFWDTQALAQQSGFDIDDCYFEAEDGVKTHGWLCRPKQNEGSQLPVLLWFHGNAGNLSHRADLMIAYASQGVEVLLVDYRGYGRSEGRPSEKGLYRDARAAWDFLTVERGIEPRQIIVFGESLGGAVAVQLASGVKPAGLLLVSTFTSVSDMAARHFPFVPRFLIRTKMNSESVITQIHCPKLVIHGSEDEIVPFKLGRELFDAATEPKRFIEVQRAHHNDLWMIGGQSILDEMGRFLHECAGSEKAFELPGLSEPD